MRRTPPTLKEALRDTLTEEEVAHVRRAYDIIGDIAIIEVPEELEAREQLIADTVLSIHKNVSVVAKKEGIHEGEFRTQSLRILAGEERKETMYKENGVRLKLDVEGCYFSPRSSTERKRIAGLIEPGEAVLVMFSGVGPFPVVIAKNSKAREIVGIEKNGEAHAYALENKRLNKTAHVSFYHGDVNEVVPSLDMTFDRVVMPLPKTGEDFLSLALSVLRKGGYLHFYDFQQEGEYEFAAQKVRDAVEQEGRALLGYDVVRCGQYAPRVNRVCVDARVE